MYNLLIDKIIASRN